MSDNLTAAVGCALPRAGADTYAHARPEQPEARRAADVAGQRQEVSSERQRAAEERVAVPDRGQLDEAIGELNQLVRNQRTNVEFSVDDESGEMIVKVMDAESKEVIRQLPPESALALARFFSDLKADESDARELRRTGNGLATGRARVEGLLIREKA